MNHREYVADREARESAFKEAREALHPQYEFRRALIAARIRSGLTQVQIAERLETTQSAVARLESGQTTPTVDTLCKLATVLGIRFEITASGLHVAA